MNHRNALRISRHYGVEATMPFISRICVITLVRASLFLCTTFQAALCYRTKVLTKGKRVSLHIGIKKLDREDAVHDRPALADELVEPVVGDHAFAVGVRVGAVAFAGRGAVDRVTKKAAPERSPMRMRVGKEEPLLKDEIMALLH